MKALPVFGLAVVLVLVGASVSPGEDPTFQQQLDQWLPGMGAREIPARRDPQQKLQQALFRLGAPGREAELADACKAVAAKLGPETAKPTRIWLLRQLEFNGGAECVDGVAVLLDDKDSMVRDAARRALANNRAPTANAKLLAKMQSTKDNQFKADLLNALGFRADAGSVAAVARELTNTNQPVAVAAARALGKIGNADAAKALAAVRTKVKGEVRFRVTDAYLQCAENLLKEGKNKEAAAIYTALNKPEETKLVRLAAMQGLLKAAGKTDR